MTILAASKPVVPPFRRSERGCRRHGRAGPRRPCLGCRLAPVPGRLVTLEGTNGPARTARARRALMDGHELERRARGMSVCSRSPRTSGRPGILQLFQLAGSPGKGGGLGERRKPAVPDWVHCGQPFRHDRTRGDRPYPPEASLGRRHLGHRRRGVARPPLNSADLARVRRGIQPEDRETGRPLCLECGAWYWALASGRAWLGLPGSHARGRFW